MIRNRFFGFKSLFIPLAVLLVFVGFVPALAQEGEVAPITNPLLDRPQEYTVMGIKVTGTENYNPEFIASSAGINEGDKIIIPGDDLARAIKRLYRTGLFSDVQVYKSQQVGNTIFLEFRVKEQPRLDTFKFRGVKKSEGRELKDEVNLLSGFAVTESGKAQSISTIKRFFKEKGYQNTKVNTYIESRDTTRNRVVLVFEVNKGERLQIERIDINGASFFDEDKGKILDQIIFWKDITKKYSDEQLAAYNSRMIEKKIKPLKKNGFWRWSKQIYTKDKFEEGMEELGTFYRTNGYRDFRIVSDSLYVYEVKRRNRFIRRKKGPKIKEGLALILNLEEGPQYHVRNISWEGNTVFTEEQLGMSLEFSKGDVFNETKYEENLYFNEGSTDVSSLYNNAGYLFFNVAPEIKIVEGDSLDLHFVITEDEKATIREVIFTGNTYTHDNVVRRSIRTVPGDYFSRAAIQRSVRELATLGFFVPEKIRPNVINVDYERKTADVIFELDESLATNNFELSGGFGGQGIGLILSMRINLNNFSVQNIGKKDAWGRTIPLPTGDGQKLSVGVQVTGTGFQTYDFNFSEPWFLGRPNSLGLGFSYSIFNRQGTREELFNTSISLGRRLMWPDDYFTHTSAVSFQKFNVQNSAFLDAGIANLLIFRQILERNSLDNFISPNRGSKLTLSGEVAPPVFNLSQYYKVKFAYQNHIPVVGKLILTNTVEFGHMGWLMDDRRSNFQRFQLGGTPLVQRQTFTIDAIDLKGFPGGREGSVSPTNEAGNPVGGTVYDKYSSELRIAAVQNEQLQLIPYMFAEGGNAFLDFERWDPFDVKRSAGFGMRLFLPILGLIDLSYGYRFDGIPGTRVESGQWQFLFNIGPPF